MSRENISINRPAVTSLAYFGDIYRLQALYKETRRTMLRLGLGPFDDPVDDSAPQLDVPEPYPNAPSMLDIIDWMNSLNIVSDSDSEDSDSDDDSVDDLEWLTRLYATVDARINPAFRSAIIEEE